jgi:hypothetical protein
MSEEKQEVSTFAIKKAMIKRVGVKLLVTLLMLLWPGLLLMKTRPLKRVKAKLLLVPSYISKVGSEILKHFKQVLGMLPKSSDTYNKEHRP